MTEKRPMTVGELIAALSQFPPETRVLVDGYEGGRDDPEPPKLVEDVGTNTHGGMHGWYTDDCHDWDRDPAIAGFTAVVLSRP